MDKILVTRSSMPELEEYIEEIKELWDSHWLTNMGVKHNILQKQLENYLKVSHMELLTNGHMALELALQALELPTGGEVITTPFTFASTTHAIVRNRLKPIFCDIFDDDFTIDVTRIEKLITVKTCAIVPVHVYGNICNVEEIDRIAKEYGLKVIYDAAHAFGVCYKGQGVGNFGDASCFSFHATKVFNTIEGGAVAYRNEKIGKKLYQLKNFGVKDAETVDEVGANAKMNEFQAAMGICNLRHIEEEINKRRIVTERYKENLSEIKGIRLNGYQNFIKSNYAYFPVVINEKEIGCSRNEVYDALAREDILARKYFYPLTSTFGCYKNQYSAEDTPVAQYIAAHVLTLPLYADLRLDDVDRICAIILNVRQ